MQDQVVYISHPLDLSSMVCMMLKMPRPKDSSVSSFTQTTLRCRQLIFDFPGHVLASPITDTSTIQVMCLATLHTSNSFTSKLEKLQLSLCGKIPISTSMLEEAMSYTMMARLSPAWNKVGDWLLGGRQFLHQADRIPAVQVKLHMADTRIELTITATTVVFPLLQPDDLGLEFESMKNFIEGDRTSTLNMEHFGLQSVLVLPKLTKGKLVSVTKQLPSESKFSQWSAMKRYWKNMYGYRLEVEEGQEPLVYYNVSFWSGSVLTYPEWTVRRSSPRPVPRSDPRPVLDLFTRELQELNRLVCGNTFKLYEKPLMPLVEAVKVSQAVEGGNISARVGWEMPKVPYRSEEITKRSHQSFWKGPDAGEDDSGYVTDISQVATSSGQTDNSKDTSVTDREVKEPPTRPSFVNTQVPTSLRDGAKKQPGSDVSASSNTVKMIPHFSSISSSRSGCTSSLVPSKSKTSLPIFKSVQPTSNSPGLPTLPSSTATKPSLQNLMNSLPIKSTFLSRLVSSGSLTSSGDSLPEKPLLPLPGMVVARPPSTTPSFLARPPGSRPPLSSPNPKKVKLTTNDNSFTEPTTPAPRKKPAVQSVDISQLVKEKGVTALVKVNTATLLDYCRKEGIKAAKSKCKKDELVRLVLVHNNIHPSVTTALENEK